MTIPTIHLNGTSRESLMDGFEAAYYALGKAYDVLKQTAPNGRDYYPQGPHALQQAADEHMARLRKIDEVRDEISELMCAISETTS